AAAADAGAESWRQEGLAESELAQACVAVGQRRRPTGGRGDLRVVAGIGGAGPGAMGGEDGVVTERLRGLYAAQRLALGLARHHAAFGAREAVHHREDRNCAGVVFESREQAIDDFGGTVGAGGIVDQHAFGPIPAKRFETTAYRFLARGAAGDEANS